MQKPIFADHRTDPPQVYINGQGKNVINASRMPYPKDMSEALKATCHEVCHARISLPFLDHAGSRVQHSAGCWSTVCELLTVNYFLSSGLALSQLFEARAWITDTGSCSYRKQLLHREFRRLGVPEIVFSLNDYISSKPYLNMHASHVRISQWATL